MSLETWKIEFYPVEAQDVPVKQALDHSIRKWEGLRRENLVRHECHARGGVFCSPYVASGDDDKLEIDADTCALCTHHYTERNCPSCPLSLVRGGVRCDRVMDDEAPHPYAAFLDLKDPEPMLKWLYAAKKVQDAHAKE
jgi:hypothetical protein